mmetsp:Transcript_14736/g.39467  ORF Transcript_14736/g.39467 Transcript_14736/m.39467 type:complete len:244 (+) Transcript_14736:1617-2348(+)
MRPKEELRRSARVATRSSRQHARAALWYWRLQVECASLPRRHVARFDREGNPGWCMRLCTARSPGLAEAHRSAVSCSRCRRSNDEVRHQERERCERTGAAWAAAHQALESTCDIHRQANDASHSAAARVRLSARCTPQVQTPRARARARAPDTQAHASRRPLLHARFCRARSFSPFRSAIPEFSQRRRARAQPVHHAQSPSPALQPPSSARKRSAGLFATLRRPAGERAQRRHPPLAVHQNPA